MGFLIKLFFSMFGSINFSGIFEFLKKNWQVVALVLLIGGSYWYVKSLNNQITDLNKEVTELKVANAMCENSRATLKGAIDTQNSEIQKWVNVGRKSKKAFDDLKGTIEKQRQISALELQKILQEKKPETCQEAINYLVDGVKDLKWQTK